MASPALVYSISILTATASGFILWFGIFIGTIAISLRTVLPSHAESYYDVTLDQVAWMAHSVLIVNSQQGLNTLLSQKEQIESLRQRMTLDISPYTIVIAIVLIAFCVVLVIVGFMGFLLTGYGMRRARIVFTVTLCIALLLQFVFLILVAVGVIEKIVVSTLYRLVLAHYGGVEDVTKPESVTLNAVMVKGECCGFVGFNDFMFFADEWVSSKKVNNPSRGTTITADLASPLPCCWRNGEYVGQVGVGNNPSDSQDVPVQCWTNYLTLKASPNSTFNYSPGCSKVVKQTLWTPFLVIIICWILVILMQCLQLAWMIFSLTKHISYVTVAARRVKTASLTAGVASARNSGVEPPKFSISPVSPEKISMSYVK